MFVKIERIEG